MHMPLSIWRTALGALTVPLLSAQPGPVRATIKPSVVRLAPGAQQRFKVILIATRLRAASAPASVKWAVNDVPGGNAEFGTIDAAGLYRAPAKAPVPHEICIRAEAEGAANRYLWATVLMGDPDPAYKLIGSWAEKTSDPGRLRKPHGISFDLGGNLLITDQGAGRVFRYTPQGKFLGEIGKGPGSEAGQFTEPRFALVGASGNIFVTDLKGDRPRLQVFDPQGRFQRIFAEKGTGPGQILRGHGLAFDRHGRLFATDVDNMRVSIFEPSGKFVSSWGKDGMNPGDFNAPHGLYMDPNDDVFVNGYYGPTQKFTPGGNFLFAFAHGDPPDGPVFFHSIAGDRWGNVYVTVRTLAGYQGALESQAGRKLSLVKYNNNGDFISSLSLSVKEHIESWAVVDAQGNVYALYTSRDEAGVEIYAPQ